MAREAPLWPGLLLTFVLALFGLWVHALPFAPFTIEGRHPVDAILLAIVFGVLLRNTVLQRWASLAPQLNPGIKYSVKRVLPFAIVLMGAKLDFQDVLRISRQGLVLSLVCVVVAIFVTLWVCKRLRVGRKLALLIGVGTAICGGTAIVVCAPTIEADDNETAFAVTTITLFGLAAIFAFPLLGAAMGMSEVDFGVWAGVSIQATPQVMAAGFSYGPVAGEVAVVVKLVRVLLLAPMVVILGAWYAREKRAQSEPHVARRTPLRTLVPPFIVGFLLLAVANSLQLLPDFTLHLRESFLWAAGDQHVSMARAATGVSGFLITMAMAGVGLGVHLPTLRRVGLEALYAGLASAVILAGFALLMLRLS